jgi:hypothetical protein
MKHIVYFLIVMLLFSCKKEETTTVNEAVDEIKETTEVVAQEGKGKITLKCNGKELVAEGVCGALVTMGELVIAVKDKTNPAKVFMIAFNGTDFPENGSTYAIKPKDYSQEEASSKDEVSVSFSEGLPNNKMNTWGSENAQGTIQFQVNGNEIKCTLKGIQLQASEMYNAEDLKGVGEVSGEFTVWKSE